MSSTHARPKAKLWPRVLQFNQSLNLEMQSFEQYKNLTISQCNHTDSPHIVMQQFPSSQKQLQYSQIVESAVKWADKKINKLGPGRSWIAGPAGISRLGPNSEPRGNNRSFPETRERDRVPVKKIGSRDSIFGLVNSTYSFEITNHNQLVSNNKYLANFIKKYWTYFRYQKLADFLVCLPPSVRV